MCRAGWLALSLPEREGSYWNRCPTSPNEADAEPDANCRTSCKVTTRPADQQHHPGQIAPKVPCHLPPKITDHGYHHYGTEIDVPASYKFPGMTDGPETIVRAVLKSWTHPHDAEPGARPHRAQPRGPPQSAPTCARRSPPPRPGPSPRRCLTSRTPPNETGHRKRTEADHTVPAERPDPARKEAPAVARRASDEELLAGALHARIERLSSCLM
jgi:hypothetical protein